MEIKINIPTGAKKILDTLHQYGFKAHIVGGCVRDCILGRTPKDWDICTSATPDVVMDIFQNEHIIETGLQHGTVTIMIDHIGYEVTTYRIDGKYSDGRRPDSVSFTNDLWEDLRRRDFTINAMAYNDKDGLLDPWNGMYDIEHKQIRCIPPASDRLTEDALRILRAIRFACQLNFKIDFETGRQAILKCYQLNNISMERINSELCKMIMSEQFYTYLFEYHSVFSVFIPELRDIMNFDQKNPYHDYDVFCHTLHALEYCDSNDLVVRLAVLFHDFGKPFACQEGEDGYRHFKGHGKISAILTQKIMKRLKFDNETIHDVVELVNYHDATLEVGKKYIKRWLNKIGEKQFRCLLQVRRADIKGQKLNYDHTRIDKVNSIEYLLEQVIEENECFTLKDLAVHGLDLIAIGYTPGIQLGETLQKLLSSVISEDVQNNKEDLLKLAKEWL